MASCTNVSSEAAMQFWVASAAVDWLGEWIFWAVWKTSYISFHIHVNASWSALSSLLAKPLNTV
jgi:hypothetical protein